MPALPPERPGCPKAPGGHRPLPDPAAVRLCLVPDSAPPYDDEVPAAIPPRRDCGTGGDGATVASATRRPGAGGPAEGGSAAGAPVTPKPRAGGPAPDRSAGGAPVTRRPGAGGPATGGSAAGAGRGPAGMAPGWQSRFAQVLAETLAGSRPPRQIVPWTTQRAREHIQRLGPRMASAQRPRVRRVVTYRPAANVMEMAVVVGFGSRVRALAVRLERSTACPTAGSGESAAPDGPVSRGGATVRSGATGRGEPAVRWVCTAVEAA